MTPIDKKTLSERDIVTKCVLPALARVGWDVETQVREEVTLTRGRVIVKGQKEQERLRAKGKRADIVLYYKPNLPLAVIEAKNNTLSVKSGTQQAIEYASMLDVPFAYSTNGDAFQESDISGQGAAIEREIAVHAFPSPDELWRRYCAFKNIPRAAQPIVAQGWHLDMEGRPPRYYQIKAVNRAVEAIARGQDRILLVMATGTGKTYTAFQIIWRLWKAGAKKRILFLADRNILIDQARNNDFMPLGQAMTKIEHRTADKSFEIYLALYQAVSGNEEQQNIYRQFSPGFFDLVIVDECHRGSAAETSAWREILTYFSAATQIGLTATPKETADVSNIDYFGEPIYTYSLREGIDDGFLAPYRVIRVDFDKDLEGYTPGAGKRDKHGQLVPDRTFRRKDFDRTLVLEKRTGLVARKVSEYLKETDRFAKTIVFCEDIEHAERMRSALANENADLFAQNRRYVRKITGDDPVGKFELADFISPKSREPVIATTSKLLTTGVDAQTCKLIVIDQEITSMTEFKQIIGRGTRIREDYGKMWFTIMDFRGATELFADPHFDGPPEQIYTPKPGDPIVPPEIGEGSVEDEPSGVASVMERAGRRQKFVIDDEPVAVVSEAVERYGSDGQRIGATLEEHTRATVRALFSSREELTRRWVTPGERAAILGELERRGVPIGELSRRFGEDVASLDILSHVAFTAPLLLRRERARSARVRGVLDARKGLARATLEALRGKFADEGVEALGDLSLLKVKPFDKLGTLVEIVRAFGGKVQYEQAVRELEEAIYDGT